MPSALLADPPALPSWPAPGSAEESARFASLQASFVEQFETVFPDRMKARTVVVVPSLTMDPAELSKISGVHHYEERMLFTLMLLRMPRTRLIFVTSQPIAPGIIDYHLQLLAGVPSVHARERLTLLSCFDGSTVSLTQKLLSRPRLLRRIQNAITDPSSSHLTCFNATALERTLAVRLGIPLYACDPSLGHLGTKSGSREAFREAGVLLPDGFENLRDENDVFEAVSTLKRRNPGLRRAVVKLNEGFSGEGNAVFDFEGAPSGAGLSPWVKDTLPGRLRFEAKTETWPRFSAAFRGMGGIVEAWIDGDDKRSPSVQGRVDPLGVPSVISTHDQVLGGPSGQVFLGCTFPADDAYRMAIHDAGLRIATVLGEKGALGRFGVDFISVKDDTAPDGWRHYAIEINLRKGGTTHPFLMLDFLTDGYYCSETGLYRIPTGQPRYYYASDNLVSEHYRGLIPRDLLDIVVEHGLHFNAAVQTGVVFHLIGALSEFGKLGVLCIGETPHRAKALYDRTVRVLDAEAVR